MEIFRRSSLLIVPALVLLASSARSAPPVGRDVLPRSRPIEHEQGSPYLSGERRGFLAGGFGYFSGDALLFGSGWSIGGGMEIPVNTWALVPRANFEYARSDGSSGLMARALLDGRIATLFSSRATYFEAGLGLAFYENDQPTFDYTSGTTRVESRHGAGPAWCVISGVMSDPEVRPGFMAELEVSGAYQHAAMTGLIGRVGVLF